VAAVNRAPKPRIKQRPRLLDRLTFWISARKRVDGLSIGVLSGDPELVFPRLEEALGLIKTHDRLSYDRLHRELERVWVTMLAGAIGQYSPSFNACMLDSRFLLAETTSAEMIAAVIVHEAAHARLMRCGIGYEESLRSRVEAICTRREVAFAKRLPDGEEVRESAQSSPALQAGDEFWTDEAFAQRDHAGSVEALRALGFPGWSVRALLGVRRAILALRALRLRVFRGLT
jgi:hypothetical protein